MRRDGEPASEAISKSLVTLIKAVSVLWKGQNPDWTFSYRLNNLRWWWRLTERIFSRILEIKGRFEMGL